MAARQRADRGRHGRARGLVALGVEDCRRLVRLEGAERRDARQAAGSARRSPRAAPWPAPERRVASARRSWRRPAPSAPPAPGKPSISTPSRSARLSVGRNGAPEGIVKTRGARWAMRAFYAARAGRQAGGQALQLTVERRGEPFPCVLVAGNPESQPVRRVGEGAGEDSRGQQPLKGGARVGAARPVGTGACRRGFASRPRAGARRAAPRPCRGARALLPANPNRRAREPRSQSPAR